MSTFVTIVLLVVAVDPPKPAPAETKPAVKAGKEMMGPPAPAPAPAATEAEKIARLQRTVEDGEKQLAAIKRQLEDPESEYHRAQRDFRETDDDLTRWTKDVEQYRKEGKLAEAEALEKDLGSLRRKRQRARDRFDLALQERKTLQERVATLPDKIERERKALKRMLGEATPTVVEKKTEDKPKNETVATKPETGKTEEQEKPATGKVKTARENELLREAREKAKRKEEEALKAHERDQSFTEYIEGLKRQIELEQRLVETARKKVALARAAQIELEQEQKERVDAGKPQNEIDKGWDAIKDAVRRCDEATLEEREGSDRLADLQAQLARLQQRQLEIAKEAEERDREAALARAELDKLENPFTPQNLTRWLKDHGLRMATIFAGMVLLYLLVRGSSRRIVRVMAGRERTDGREGENRAETLVGVFRTTMSAFIVIGGTLMLLDEIGIPIVPLMGGAAVLGLAVAFGAQNLIKDYFTGFMILLEDQYAVNDSARINGVEGKVERITLRMTVLRDVAGVAHFIPHGTIVTVSNMSHGWSRAALDVGIAYKEDPDYVMGVLRRLCAELRQDEHFSELILEDAEVLGIEQMTDSAVMLKILVRTRPQKQGEVKREILRRIKHRFDELGIEIPYPHRTIYYRNEAPAQKSRAA